MVNLNFKKKIVIGSANFDQRYGLSNNKLNKIEKKKILNLAKENKILTIDAAENYFKNKKIFRNIDKQFKFITKIKPTQKWTSFKYCKKKIESHLKIFEDNEIKVILFHDIKVLYSKAGPLIYKNLLKLKCEKYFKQIGISIYDPSCLDYLTTKYNLDVVQCPYNLLDKRIIETGWFKKLKKKKIEIHARSIFLQGF